MHAARKLASLVALKEMDIEVEEGAVDLPLDGQEDAFLQQLVAGLGQKSTNHK